MDDQPRPPGDCERSIERLHLFIGQVGLSFDTSELIAYSTIVGISLFAILLGVLATLSVYHRVPRPIEGIIVGLASIAVWAVVFGLLVAWSFQIPSIWYWALPGAGALLSTTALAKSTALLLNAKG